MPTQWTTPTTLRTQNDVTNKTKKGLINAADLNRIEGNTAFLAEYLALGALDTSTTWKVGDLVFEKDIRRILAGAERVRSASLAQNPPCVAGWMPDTPAALAGFGQANDVEAIQLRARRAVDGNSEDTARTGEAVLGEKTGVL